MIKKKVAIWILVLCLCFHAMAFGAQAASTSEAIESIIPENECTLTVSYCYGETAFSDVQVKLYKIADVSADFQYTLVQSFAASGLILNGVQSAGEWNVIRSTLEAYILAHDIAADATSATNQDGQVHFDALSTGMYFVTVGQAVKDGVQCLFDSALVSLPGLGQDGCWQYDVSVNAKGEILPPVDADEEVEFKVLKLWKGDEGQNARPNSVEVEIFRDGVSCETVMLSEENNWSYSWSAKDDGATWTVVERNIPEGYTMTVEAKENSFILTNTWVPTEPDTPVKPPQTGDTSPVLLYVLLLSVSGTMMIVFGITRKRTTV